MFKQNENGKKKVSKIKPLSTTASPAGMRIKDGKHDTEHNSKGRSFLFLSPHLSLSTFVRSINTTLATQAHSSSQVSWYCSPFSEDGGVSNSDPETSVDELCWLGSSQPEASGTFPSTEHVASLNMVLTQGRCVISSK